jgi:hypothetical protein
MTEDYTTWSTSSLIFEVSELKRRISKLTDESLFCAILENDINEITTILKQRALEEMLTNKVNGWLNDYEQNIKSK